MRRAPGTITRELARNRCHRTNDAYRPSKAQARTNDRHRRTCQARHHDPDIRAAIQHLLRDEKWNPEQIASWCSPSWACPEIGHTSIYRHVHRRSYQTLMSTE